MIKPSVKIEVLISGSWVDLSDDVQRPIECTLGIGGSASPQNRTAGIGRLTFSLDNSARNSQSTLGYYSPDHTNALSGWEEDLKIRAFMYHASYQSGTQYSQFVGWIQSISPTPRLYGTRTVQVKAVDYNQILVDFDDAPLVDMLIDSTSPLAYNAILERMATKPEGFKASEEYLIFNGSTSQCICDNHSSLENLHSGDVTWEGYFKPDSAGESNLGRFFQNGNNSVGGWAITMSSATTGIYISIAFNTTNINETLTGFSALDDGEWHHIAVTYTGTGDRKARLFVDGVLEDTSAASAGTVNENTGADIGIGCTHTGNFSFDGGIGWCRISDTIRYDSNFTPPDFGILPLQDSNTLALWKMLEGTGSTVADTIGNSNGTLTDVTWAGYNDKLDFLPYIFHRSGERSGSGMEEVNRVALSVFDYIFVDRNGYFVAQNRGDRIQETTVQFTISDDLVDLSFPRDRSRAYDRIVAVTHPVKIGSGVETAFELEAPIRINPGDSYTLIANYSEPNSTRPCGITNPTTLATGTNVSFGSLNDLATSDLNSDLGITANFYSGAAEIVFTNNGDQLGFVNQVDITGNLLRFYNPAETTKVVNASGTRTLRYDLPYQDSDIFAENANEMIAAVYNQSSGLGVRVDYRGNTLTTFGYFISGDIGKRIRITETVTGASSYEGFINRIHWTLTRDGELRIDYIIAPASTSTNGIWGTSTWGNCVWRFAEG